MSGALVPAATPPVGLQRAAASAPPVRNAFLVYLGRLSPASRRSQATALETIATLLTGGAAGAQDLPWHELRYPHTAAVRSELARRYAPATANRHLSALRGVLQEAWRLGAMSAEDRLRACDVRNVTGTRIPAGREIAGGELRRLFASCAEDLQPARGSRDAALLAVLYGAGLRRAEAAALDVAAYDPARGTLRLVGKGNRERLAHLGAGGTAAVDGWLHVRGPEPGALLCPVGKGGRVRVRRMTGQSIRDALRRRARHAGVASFAPHDCRRTFIGDLLDAGADLAAVQRLAGHASPATTSAYDRRGERAKARAASMLHVPYIAAT